MRILHVDVIKHKSIRLEILYLIICFILLHKFNLNNHNLKFLEFLLILLQRKQRPPPICGRGSTFFVFASFFSSKERFFCFDASNVWVQRVKRLGCLRRIALTRHSSCEHGSALAYTLISAHQSWEPASPRIIAVAFRSAEQHSTIIRAPVPIANCRITMLQSYKVTKLQCVFI